LFVELQQSLGDVSGRPPEQRLQLIDDLAQRRLKPLSFLRKWNEELQAPKAGRVEVPPDFPRDHDRPPMSAASRPANFFEAAQPAGPAVSAQSREAPTSAGNPPQPAKNPGLPLWIKLVLGAFALIVFLSLFSGW
jgi:hypothetical protein